MLGTIINFKELFMKRILFFSIISSSLAINTLNAEKGFWGTIMDEVEKSKIKEEKEKTIKEQEEMKQFLVEYRIPKDYFNLFQTLGKKVYLDEKDIVNFIKIVDDARKYIRVYFSESQPKDENGNIGTSYSYEYQESNTKKHQELLYLIPLFIKIGITGKESNIKALSLLIQYFKKINTYDREDILSNQKILCTGSSSYYGDEEESLKKVKIWNAFFDLPNSEISKLLKISEGEE